MLRILIACEESQTICNEFRKLGHIAFSCDLQPCSGGHTEWHIQADCIPLLGMDWDLIIAHPPCTYLSNAGKRYLNVDEYGEYAARRLEQREEAAAFFMLFTNLRCKHVAIENPRGYMSEYYRKEDQVIHPWQFGDPVSKATCLWLEGLPPLKPYVEHKPDNLDKDFWYRTRYLPADERRRQRSKTFPGIAHAIATQWSEYIINEG